MEDEDYDVEKYGLEDCNRYVGEYYKMQCELRNAKKIKDAFNKRTKDLDEKEWEELDEEWAEMVPDLEEFYGGYNPKGKRAEEKKQRYLDYLYMYYILHPNHEWNERYDQPIFASAVAYAEALDKDDGV